MSKSIVVTFGRFNPPTTGHEQLVNTVIKVAKAYGGAEHRIYTSMTRDNDKNPLPYAKKVKFLRKGFPYANVIEDTDAVTIFHVMKKLSDDGYKKVILVVGSDRVKEFDRGIRRYINHSDKSKAYYFDEFKVVSAGERDPDSDDVSGMSASKMRGFVRDNDLNSFMKGVPSRMPKRDAISMFNNLKRHMNIREDVEFDFEENAENIYEITLQQRRKRSIIARRTAKKRSRARKRKRKLMKDLPRLKKMAQKAARNKIRKRIIKDRDWNSLSFRERERVENLINKKKAMLKKLANRLLPQIRKKELERLKRVRGQANESYTYYEEHGAGEEGTKKLLRKYKKDTPNERPE